jgi:hypothetical protein
LLKYWTQIVEIDTRPVIWTTFEQVLHYHHDQPTDHQWAVSHADRASLTLPTKEPRTQE